MRRRSIWLVLALLLTGLPGQVRVVPMGAAALEEAQVLERRGDVEAAREIYRDILAGNPRHHQAYQNLKNSLVAGGELDEAIQLVNTYLENAPMDLNARIELGELYFRRNDKEQAFRIWKALEAQLSSNQNFYRTLIFTFARLSLPEEMEALADRARTQFNDAAFLAIDLANYYHSRGAVDRAVDEFLNHLLTQPRQLKYVTDRILLLSDEPENQTVIENRLLTRLPEDELLVRQVLAGFYFKIRRFDDAVEQHRLMGLNTPDDFIRWLELARNLRLEREFGSALAAYQTLLQSDLQKQLPVRVAGEALLGMGQCFEEQIVPDDAHEPLVRFFPDNQIFASHFYGAPEISTVPLEHSFRLYDSILVELPKSGFLAQAHFRIGEIRYRITRDFDGALQSYQAALAARPDNDLRQALLLRLGDVQLAKGALPAAQEHFLKNLEAAGTDEAANPFLLRLIQTNLLAGDVESALTLIETTIAETQPTHANFNDLLEVQNLIATYYSNTSENDRAAFQIFLQAENLIRQNKLSQGAQLLQALRREQPNLALIPLVTLRLALLTALTSDITAAVDLALALAGTELADQGLALAGEIHEIRAHQPDTALIYYHRVLEEYPRSILAEPVRFHIRALNQKLGS
ncbi:MAG: tetratricopeptide repeat protein [Candidatus Neomarinimicrobiota bacterium]